MAPTIFPRPVHDMKPPSNSPSDSHQRGETRRPPSTFGFKDVFTSINLLSGVIAIIFCFEGNVRYAAYAFLLGWVLGDALDGIVARMTHTENQFGAQFDVISDHLGQCIVPATMLYVTYRPISPYLAGALAAVLVITGSVRHARAAVKSPEIDFAYVGMPRTVSALLIISYLNSGYVHLLPGYLWYGIPLVLFISVAQLLPIPFRNHKGRRLKLWARIMITMFFVTSFGAMFTLTEITFDIVLVWLVGYSLVSWIELTPQELSHFFTEARRWAEEVRAAR